MTARTAVHVPSGDDHIGVEVCGAGPAVVLVHGANGNRATWFQQVVDLAADFTVVVVEARGAGRSTDVHLASGPAAGALDLEAVRRHLELPAWHVVGHSLGGWTALRYAVDHPERCRSVTALSSVAGVFPPEVHAFWEDFTKELAAAGWPAQDLGRPPSLTSSFCDDRPDLAYLYQLVGALNPPPSLAVPAARIRDFDLTADEIGRLTMPVTFLTGSLDTIAPWAVVRAAARACGASAAVLEGCGHVPQWEQPALLNQALREQLGCVRVS